MKFSIKDFFSKCDQIRTADLVTVTEEILNGKLHFLCSVSINVHLKMNRFLKVNTVKSGTLRSRITCLNPQLPVE